MGVSRGDVVSWNSFWRFDALFAKPAEDGTHPIIGIAPGVRFDGDGVDNRGQAMTVGVEPGTELSILRRLGDRLRGVNNDPHSTDMTVAIGSHELVKRLVAAGLDEAAARVLVVELRQVGESAEV